MEEFKKELAAVLRKHDVAIIAKGTNAEVGFQVRKIANKWTGQLHVTAYDLDGLNIKRGGNNE